MKRDRINHAVIVCAIVCIFLVTGCETLRKKFVRKRKKTESTEPMVIVPRDYSAHPFPSDVLYKQYFVYWKSWNQELVSSLIDKLSYKKILDCAQQSLVNLRKMKDLLADEKANELQVYIDRTQDLEARIEHAKNLPPSQMNMLKYDAERILSTVNRNFDSRKMKDHLK
ncbi:MAG TPA: hypothetical protein DCL35_04165 [Candidatus Omnitrophica bacterium]|nr:hypothetical protein [Candidatus Omnitrophota bacterium]